MSHTQQQIAFAVILVSQFMHSSYEEYIEVVY